LAGRGRERDGEREWERRKGREREERATAPKLLIPGAATGCKFAMQYT